MKRSKVILSLIIVLASSLVWTVGCTNPATQQTTTVASTPVPSNTSGTAVSAEPVELTWATWTIAEEALKPTYMSMIETFMADNSNVTIGAISYPYAQYLDQLIISAAAGNAPSFAHIKAEWCPQFVDMDVQLNLDNVLSEELKADYFENILAGTTVDGHIVAAPWFNSPYALYYNKTLMEKAGITELPKNWDELIADSYKISALGSDDNGNKIYGYALPNSKTEYGCGYNCFPHLWAYGGNFIDNAGNVAINSAENISAYTEIQKLYKDQISPNGSGFKDIRNLFAQGIVGFYFDLQMAAKTFVEASPLGADFAKEFGVMVIPSKEGSAGYGYVVEHYLMVFDTVDESAYSTINKVIDHFTGPTVMQILYDAGMGKMPDRTSVTQMDIFTNPTDEKTKVYVSAVATARTLPVSNQKFMDADELLVDALTKLSTSNESAEKIVADLDAQIKALYGQ